MKLKSEEAERKPKTLHLLSKILFFNLSKKKEKINFQLRSFFLS